MSDPAITLLSKMIGRLQTDRLIVTSHKMESRKAPIHKDNRNSQIRKSLFPILCPRTVSGSDKKTIDSPRLQHAQDSILLLGTLTRITNQKTKSLLTRYGVDPLHQLRKKRSGKIWNDNPQNVRPARDQAPSDGVWLITKLLGRRQHALARRLSNVLAILKRCADRRNRYIEVTRDVLEPNSLRLPLER